MAHSFQWNRDHVAVSIDSVQNEDDPTFPAVLRIFNGSAKILLPSIAGNNYLSSFLATESVSIFNLGKQRSIRGSKPSIQSILRAPLANLSDAGGLAKMANLLFPGTVNNILVDMERSQSSGELDSIPKTFPWQENTTLGVILPIRKCETEAIYEKLVDKDVGMVVFTFWPDPINVDSGVERNASEILNEFEVCEKGWSYSAMRNSETEKLSLAFLTGWRGNCMKPEEERFAEQLAFWKTMNDWAVKRDVTVILKYMVCARGTNETDRWWRWVQNRTSESDLLASTTSGRNDTGQEKGLKSQSVAGNRTVDYKAQKFNRAWASSTTATDCSEPRIEDDGTVVRLVTTCSVTTTITLLVKGTGR